MKKTSVILLSAILASGAMLASCTPNAKETIEVYKDNSEAKIGNTLVRINDIYSSTSYSADINGYRTRMVFRFQNVGESEQNISIKKTKITCEDDKTTYSFEGLPENETLNANESSLALTYTVIPTPLEESHYSLSAIINDVNYLVHLYEKPDSKRQDYTVNYQIGDKTVHTATVKEGRPIGEDYIYENPNHLSYCSAWKDQGGNPVGSLTKVNGNLTIFGEESNNILFRDKDELAIECSATSLDYIPSDRVVVIPSTYKGASVNELAEGFLFSKQVKTVYLPKSIKTIKEKNFFRCQLLETINFEGTKEEWNAISNLSLDRIPDEVTINFERPFSD